MNSTPRRNPREHTSSQVRTQDPSQEGNPLTPRVLFQSMYTGSINNGENNLRSRSSYEDDRRAMSPDNASSDDDYPPPPSPLETSNRDSPNALPEGAENQDELAHSIQPPSIPVPGTQPPSSYAPTTQPPSTYAPTTQPPSTFAPTTQPSSFAPTTQPPSTYAPSTQPPSTWAPTTQPPSSYAPTTQPPSTYAPTTQPPSTFAPTTQPPSTFAPTAQPPSCDIVNTQVMPSNSTEEEIQEAPGITSNTQHQPARGDAVGSPATADETEKEKDLQRLYVHLHRITVHHQKSVAAAFEVLQVGNKAVRAARLFVVISGTMKRRHKTALQTLAEKAIEKGKDFRTEYERTIEVWSATNDSTIVPPIAELEALGGVRQDPPPPRARDAPIEDESDGGGDQGADAQPIDSNLTLEEFARLMLIFRDNREAEMDLRRSGQDMTRAQLDIGSDRNAFWTERIEGIFNDPVYQTNEQLTGAVSHIDPGRPVRKFRTGQCLQDLFARFRKEFTSTYNNWDVSGRMDHSTFRNFCRLPGLTRLSRSGARCLIAWQIFKFGTRFQNSLLLDFCCKEMSRASGAALESGLNANGESGVTSRRKRRSQSGEGSLHDSTGALADALRSFSQQNEEDGPVCKKKKEELVTLSVINAKHENERKLLNSLVEAQKLRVSNQGNEDQRFAGILDRYYNSLATGLEKSMEED